MIRFFMGLIRGLFGRNRRKEGACRIRRVMSAGLFIALTTTAPGNGQNADMEEAFPALQGLRFGVSVTDLDGNVLEAHRADERFTPASNMKLFVTAAALEAETELAALESGLQVVLEYPASGPPNLVLVGRGDPTVGVGPSCDAGCLESLAASVSATGIEQVGDIIGDDQWFADERKPLGWSWDDLKFGHGTAISAIAVNDNVLPLRVSPANEAEANVRATWIDGASGYFDLNNEAVTQDGDGQPALRLERRIGDETARLYGELPLGSRSFKLSLGVDNPAHLAAWYFKQALVAEGIVVTGQLRTRRRPLQFADEPVLTDPDDPDAPLQCAASAQDTPGAVPIASLDPAPLQDIVTRINRDSQNLYAEVLLRQLGRAAGIGASFCGLLQIEDFLTEIGVERASYDIADGSGLSNYNRATPATITALLRHAATAPWGEAFLASLPVSGGAKGTLKYRFRGTALDGKVFAKTGTLNHVDALSGYLTARSGQTLVFSIIVNDRPLESPSAMPLIEQTLLSIAEQY
ncbi:MAG: D-alanyl-D-alanine carboxypeptidase/D-alanyl-D-alanine-endopeptidase [Henriciella sp.]|nr:D-alanyl-D-alanine carboxypeptidase/D-alanyl-D-alanine-endopeptidase [Henriciella sp.]